MNNKKITKRTGLMVSSGLLLGLALQGCSGVVLKQVSEKNRDHAGVYNGTWQSTVRSTAKLQSGGGGWELTCADQAGRNLGVLKVENGVATLGKKNVSTAFVNKSGQFRFEIPVAEVAAASGTSDSTISNGRMTILLYGSLKKQTGTLTYGIAEFSNNGCSSKVNYTKV